MRFLVLLFLPMFCNAQKKGDTKIVVQVIDTANLLTRMATHFYERGYLIEVKDESAGYIETEKRSLTNFQEVYKLSAFIQDKSIIFSCLVCTTQTATNCNEAKYDAKKGTVNAQAWAAMKEIAKEFGELRYE